jgi:MFS family permease
VIAVLAGVLGSMTVLLLGAVLLGSTSAAGLGARYAATDLAPEATRGRSLSIVVWATTIGAVAGPNLTTLSSAVARTLSIPTLTGPFALGAVSMLVAAVVLWVLLRPDPLLLARVEAGQAGNVRHGTSWGRVGEVVREQPLVGAAIAGLAAAHAVMVGVMVMTPLHMQHGHAELRVIGLVISVHVLGMFAFAPVMGWAADRFGRVTLMAVGGVVLLAALLLAGVSPAGSSWQIFAGLFLLGLGWSAVMVAASTLLTTHVPLGSRTDVQGASDMTMNIAAAGSAGLAGFLVDAWGYPQLNLFAAVLATVVLAAAALARSREPTRLTDR